MMTGNSPYAAHILSVAQTLRGGGVERSLLKLAAGWLDAGRRVTLLVGKADGPLMAELPPGIGIIERGSAAFTDLHVLHAVARDVRPDVIFCPGNHYTSVAAMTKLWMAGDAPPIVAKISNALVRADHGIAMASAYRWWLRRHPAFIDHFVAMSPAMRDEAIATMHLDPARISVIANPAPRHDCTLPPADMPNGRMLVGVGRLENQKRWDRLINAMARIDDRQATLAIIGEGSARPALAAQIARMGLANRVRLTGYISNPTPYVAAARAAVLTSDFEGVPNVLREALAVGTPVVATESSVAVREIITQPGLGSIVPTGDPAALVAALNHWLAPAAKRPAPVAWQGNDPVQAYLALFDRLVAGRRVGLRT